MTYDPRWTAIAREWLVDSDLPAHLVTKYTDRLAQRLHDVAEQEPGDIFDDEQRSAEAAHGEHIDRLIDESRGN